MSLDSSTGTVQQAVVCAMEDTYSKISNRRYLFQRKPYRKGYSAEVFMRDLADEDDADGVPPWLTDDEFLQKYRIHRESFKKLVSMIKDHPAFKPRRKGRKQAPVEYQLLVFLYYIGREGSGANNPTLRNVFGIGRGTAEKWKKRCIAAIRSLREKAISWPDKEERLQIAKNFFVKYDFMNCIGVADGTLFPLTYAPESDDAPDYLPETTL